MVSQMPGGRPLRLVAHRPAGDARADVVGHQIWTACWRALPVFVVAALAGAAATVAVVTFVPVIWVDVIVVGAGIIGPLGAIVALRLALEMEGPHVPRLPTRWHVGRAVAVCSVPAGAVGSLMCTLELWAAAAGQWWTLVAVACTAIVTVVVGLASVVALPTAVLRGDVRLRTIWLTSVFAVTRAPSAPLGTLALAAWTGWLTARYTIAATAFVPILALAIGLLAAQTCLGRSGVVLEYRQR